MSREPGRACAACLKPERPWRRMTLYPLGTLFAYVCSDRCHDNITKAKGGNE